VSIEGLVTEIQRLRIGPDEVLVVRPKGLMSVSDTQILMRNLKKIAQGLGWDSKRIVVLERDVDLTVVKAEQLEMGA
jgi:predicted O-linked N-acetylglucosamine transferase (SPINDLY family)